MSRRIWTLTLFACFLLLTPVGFAQENATASGQRVVLLGMSTSNQARSTVAVTRIMISTEEAVRADKGLIEAKARREGNNLIIEFADPLPGKSRTLSIASKLALDPIGEPFCMVGSGRYNISYSQDGTAVVTLPLTNNAVAEAEGHRRRKTKFWSNIG